MAEAASSVPAPPSGSTEPVPPGEQKDTAGGPRYRVVQSFLWVVGGRLLAAFIQALTLVLLARGTEPERFGMVSAFMGAAIVLQTVVDLGVSGYALKVRAADAFDPAVALCVRIYRRLGVLLLGLVAAVGIGLAIVDRVPWWLFLPLGVGMAIERQADMRLNLAVADGDTWKNSSVLVARRIITLVLLALLSPLLGAVVAYGAGLTIGAVLSWLAGLKLITVPLGEPRGSTPPAPGDDPPAPDAQPLAAAALIRTARPFWADSVMAQIRSLDALIVTAVAAPIQAGYYGAISRSVSPLRMVGTSLASVMLPAAVKSGRSDKRRMRRILLALFAGLAVLYALLGITAGWWVILLLGQDYAGAVPGFRLLLAGLALDGVSSVIGAVMLGSRLESVVAWSVTIASLLGLVLVAGGGLLHGSTGAAAGLAASYVLQFLIMLAGGGHLFFGRDRGRHL